MRRATRRGLALASIAVSAGLAVPAYAAPAQHSVADVTGDTISCGSTTYTITSGSIRIVEHADESASGNANFTVTLTPQHVVAEDADENVYSVRARSGLVVRSTHSRARRSSRTPRSCKS
jgi:hypothetical protein